MSRTIRNIVVYKEDFQELNALKNLLKVIEDTREKHFFSNELGYFENLINKKIRKAMNIKEVKLILIEEIKIKESYIKRLSVDKGNWRGVTFRLTKEYSNMKSRSGKREMTTKILKYVNVNDMEDFDDDFLVFDEPNLGNIRGALWYFD